MRSMAISQRAQARQDYVSLALVGAQSSDTTNASGYSNEYASAYTFSPMRALIGGGVAFYSYTRTQSIAWALGAYLGGYIFPVFSIAVVAAMVFVDKNKS